MENIYQTAIDVQDACNLSGVVRSFVQVIDAVRAEPGYRGMDEEREHPAIVMFVSKIASMVPAFDTAAGISRAMAACEVEARKRGGRG